MQRLCLQSGGWLWKRGHGEPQCARQRAFRTDPWDRMLGEGLSGGGCFADESGRRPGRDRGASHSCYGRLWGLNGWTVDTPGTDTSARTTATRARRALLGAGRARNATTGCCGETQLRASRALVEGKLSRTA